jgi:hypothetical protein
MKVTLLGGSNSLYGCGIKTGISSVANVQLSNYSLGASSALQNLAACIENRESIKESDLIIAESNVNDSFNAAYLKLDLEVVKRNIAAFYSELASLGKVVFVLILPLNTDRPGIIESDSIIKEINEYHMAMIQKFGFFYVDLEEQCKNLPQDKLNLLMPDCRHMKPLFLHELLKNITTFFVRRLPIMGIEQEFPSSKNVHKLLTAKDIADYNSLKCENIENSYFSTNVVPLPLQAGAKIKFPELVWGDKLIGVGTFGTLESRKVAFKSRTNLVVKSFNELMAFNELVFELFVDFDLVLTYTDEETTEKVILEKPKKDYDNRVNFYSFIFLSQIRDEFAIRIWEGAKNLQRLIPPAQYFMFDSDYCKKFISMREGSISSLSEVRSVMSIAEKLSDCDPQTALDLARLVYKYVSSEPELKVVMDKIRAKAAKS